MSPALGVGATTASAPRRAEAELRAALAFLTRFPVGTTAVDTTGSAAFGLVGGLIGAIGAVVVLIVGGAAPIAAGALAVAVMAGVTGTLHLDGLGDTADALAAPTPEAAERARVDPRLGAAGVVAIVLALIVDSALIGTLIEGTGPGGAAGVLVAAAAAPRALAVVVAWSHREVARPGGAAWFSTRLPTAAVVLAVGSAIGVALLVAVLIASPTVIVGAVAGSLVGLLGAAWLVRARGGLDGDVLGATIELSFAAILLASVLVL